MPDQLAALSREDLVRDRILRFLFENRKRRTRGYKTTEIEGKLKAENIKPGEVRASLPYLLDNEWIVREERDRSFQSPRGTLQSASEISYRISAKGVDLVNGQGSPYSQNQGKLNGIHIGNVSGVVILGDQNVASVHALDVLRPLDRLAHAVETTDELEDDAKHDFSSDLATLRAALTKQVPNRKVIDYIMESLAPLANIASIAAFFMAVAQALAQSGLH
jgi:hypothetical protein